MTSQLSRSSANDCVSLSISCTGWLRDWCRQCQHTHSQAPRSKVAGSDPADQRTLCPIILWKTTTETTPEAAQCHTATPNNTNALPPPPRELSHLDKNTIHSDSTESFKSALAPAKRRQTTTAAYPNPSHQCHIAGCKRRTPEKTQFIF